MTADDHNDSRPRGRAATVVDEDDHTPRRGDRGSSSARTRGTRSPAAQRAIDRHRRRTVQRSTAELTRDRRGGRWARLVGSPADALRRMPFAVLVSAILAVGLVLTLWLSTTAAQDSYGLSAARDENSALGARRDALNKSYESANSAPEIAKKAAAQGLIPSDDVARMVVDPDGRVRIVGEPTPASGTPAPALPSAAPRTVVPQPGSAADTPSAGDPASVPAPNVLPGNGTVSSPSPVPPATPAPGGSATGAPQPASTQNGQTQTGQTQNGEGRTGSTDSSVPR